MRSAVLDTTARDALASACAEVREADLADHVDGVVPGVVACPADTGQVSAVLRAAAAHGLTVVPRGRGTKLSWGLPPSRADVLLDLSSLDQVLEHAAGDLIVVTQAGTRMADLQSAVAAGGQRLALDETVPGASVGGTLAVNASGARRVATGSARDLLIGITVVRADGVVAKAGGKVVKNVAGYDLGKLMVGSFGTLAVVTEAVFRLHPTPITRRWVGTTAADPAEAQRLAQLLVHSQAVPAAVEVEQSGDGGIRVHALVEGRADGVEGRAASLRKELGSTPGQDASESEDDPAGGATYPWDTSASGDDRATALKLTFALSGLAAVLAAARESGLSVRGSAGAGVLYGGMPAGTPPGTVAEALRRLRETCAGAGGSVVVVDGAAAVKQSVDVWGPVPALDLMRRVKDQFDPDHRLAPGRFVGGI